MSLVDNFLKKMRMVSNDDLDDYDDDYDDYGGDEDEDIISSSRVKNKQKPEPEDDFDDYYDDEELDETPKKRAFKSVKSPVKAAKSQKAATSYNESYQSASSANLHTVRKDFNMNDIHTIDPKSFDDANLIADRLLDGCGVILNLEGIDVAAAQRIIDFASGACYATGGNMQKINKRIFMVAPGNVNFFGNSSGAIDDMVGLNSVSMK